MNTSQGKATSTGATQSGSVNVSQSGATATGVTMGSGALAYSPSTTYTIGQAFAWSGATVTVTGTGVGTSSTKATGCDTNDIAVWKWSNIQIWAACNVGATTLYTGQTMASGTPTAWQEAYLGGMYQWGRNDDVAAGTFVWSQYNGVLTNGSTSNTNFYAGDGSYGDWYTPDINLSTPGLWNPNGSTSSIAGNNQGPCPAGYGVPSGGTSDATTEWGKLYTIFGGTYDTIRSTLKLPLSGLRNWNNGTYGSQGTVGYYWSSSPYGTYSYGAYFVVGGGNIASSTNRADGFSVRCVRH